MSAPRRWTRLFLVAGIGCGVAFGLAACLHKEAEAPVKTAALAGEIVKTSESGPVKATVTLSPAKPTLGDALHLTLKVTADKGVELRMPAFGEALGRFSITSFTPRRVARADGGTEESQEYVLEAPMSGKQKIPSLLVEFFDRRGGGAAVAPNAVDAGAGAAVEASELLTDELSLDVASVLDGEESAGELRGPLGPLPENEGAQGRGRLHQAVVAGVVVLLVSGLVAFAIFWRRRRRVVDADTAIEIALARLSDLERRGLPEPEAADAWYVEISSIVRRYLEDRFALRAPELTTEEFLARVGGGVELETGHRGLLRSFLERCDRVKFAAYRPPESESREVIAAARRFLEETRPAAAQSAAGHSGSNSAGSNTGSNTGNDDRATDAARS